MAAVNSVVEDLVPSLPVERNKVNEPLLQLIVATIASKHLSAIMTTFEETAFPLLAIKVLMGKISKNELPSELSSRLILNLTGFYGPILEDSDLQQKVVIALVQRNLYKWLPIITSIRNDMKNISVSFQENKFKDPDLLVKILNVHGRTACFAYDVRPFIERFALGFIDEDWQVIQAVFEKNKLPYFNSLQQSVRRQVQKLD